MKLRLLVVAGLCGALLMALEILASRILAPHFGNSVYVWGSIISVFLAAMSIGYFWGGRLADRRPDRRLLGGLILLAAIWMLALRMWSAGVSRELAEATGATPGGTLLACLVLFTVPGLVFGMISPFVIRLAADDLERLGNISGRIYATSTAGSLAGTLLCTFVAIPGFPVPAILSTLTAGTGATAALALVGRGRGVAESLLALTIGLSAFALPEADPGRPDEVVAVRGTAYQTIEILDQAGVRYMRSDSVTQSAYWLDSGEIASRYGHYAAAVFLTTPAPDHALVLGMGGGLVAKTWHKLAPALEVDFVEIDPAVPEVAERYGFWRPDPRQRVHIADGRRFVDESERSWDVIYVDAYIGRSVPFHMTTREFFASASRRLTEGGTLAVNLAAGLHDPFSRSLLHTLRRSFRTTLVVAVRGAGNVLVLATAREQPSRDALEARAGTFSGRGLVVPMTDIAAGLTDWQYDEGETIELRDAFAPAEHLIAVGDQDFDLELLDPSAD